MGNVLKPLPVKLIVSLIWKESEIFKEINKILSSKFGTTDYISPVFNFKQTDYYEKEMGVDLKRQFLSFEKLISPKLLVGIKLFTNKLEKKYAKDKIRRTINMDPGYLSLSKLILATTKNFAHRIYIKDGIFEEITLYYKNGSFTSGQWTYPDYACADHIAVFNEIRKNLYKQISAEYGISQLYRCV